MLQHELVAVEDGRDDDEELHAREVSADASAAGTKGRRTGKKTAGERIAALSFERHESTGCEGIER